MSTKLPQIFDQVLVFKGINVNNGEVDYGQPTMGFIMKLTPRDKFNRADVKLFPSASPDAHYQKGVYHIRHTETLANSGDPTEALKKGVYCSLTEGRKILSDRDRKEQEEMAERDRRREDAEQDRLHTVQIQSMVIAGQDCKTIAEQMGLEEAYVAEKIRLYHQRERRPART